MPFMVLHYPTFDEPLAQFFHGKKYIRIHGMKTKGDAVPSHAHHTDHDSVVICGQVRLIEGERREEHGPGAVMKILAGKVHQFEALSDDVVVACVHDDVEEKDFSKVAESLGRMPDPTGLFPSA